VRSGTIDLSSRGRSSTGRSDSRVAVFMKRAEDLHEGGVCWQIPTLLEGFRRLDGRARSEADLLR
jgi:hypothetical protein